MDREESLFQTMMMKINLLSWNVRGLGREEKCPSVKNQYDKWKIDLLTLLETKMQGISSRVTTDIG